MLKHSQLFYRNLQQTKYTFRLTICKGCTGKRCSFVCLARGGSKGNFLLRLLPDEGFLSRCTGSRLPCSISLVFRLLGQGISALGILVVFQLITTRIFVAGLLLNCVAFDPKLMLDNKRRDRRFDGLHHKSFFVFHQIGTAQRMDITLSDPIDCSSYVF